MMINNSLIAAGIDIGSNTFRLLIARIAAGRFTVLVKKLITVRLGQGLVKKNALRPDAIKRAHVALRSFNKILAEFQPQVGRACGTAALRAAENREEFLCQAQKTFGMNIEVISGDDEARLSLIGAQSFQKRLESGPILLADVGGGSTELVLSTEYIADNISEKLAYPQIVSLPLGAVGLTEEFLAGPMPTESQVMNMTGFIEDALSPIVRDINTICKQSPPQILGTGGTATSMAALDLEMSRYNEFLIQGHVLSEMRLNGLWSRLARLPAEKRNLLPGLRHGRGEIILAGIKVYQVLLELLDTRQMIISDAGLLEGILLSGARTGCPSFFSKIGDMKYENAI